jgi:hypothetical protein
MAADAAPASRFAKDPGAQRAEEIVEHGAVSH